MSAPLPSPLDPYANRARRWGTLLGVGLAIFMSTLDGGITQIALPALMRIFRAPFPVVQWVALSYLLVLTSTMLTAARLGDLLGRRRLFALGVGIFTVASLLCGLSPGIGWLIAFRAVQGLGSVLVSSLGTALVTEAFPPHERGKALGLIGSVVSVGIGLGPSLGGILLGLAGWRWLFFVNLPVGLAAFLVIVRLVPESPRALRSGRFDHPGAVLLLALLSAYTISMTLGQQAGFRHPGVVLLLLAAALLLPVFLRREQRASAPMLDLSLFRSGLLGLNLLMGFLAFVVQGSVLLLPFFLDLVLHAPPERAGLMLAVVPISMGLTAPWAGSLADRYGSRGISLFGLLVITGSCWLASTLHPEVGTLGYVLRLIPFGIGIGMFQSPNNRAIMQAAPHDRLGTASGLLALSRTLGQVSGLPLMAALFAIELAARGASAGRLEGATPGQLTEAMAVTLRMASGLALAAAGLAATAWRLDRGTDA